MAILLNLVKSCLWFFSRRLLPMALQTIDDTRALLRNDRVDSSHWRPSRVDDTPLIHPLGIVIASL